MANIIGGTRHDPRNDSPAICERCGSPIANEVFIEQDGEIHSYGTTCACRIVGNAIAERTAREAHEQKLAERRSRQKAMNTAKSLAPFAEEISELEHKAAELNKTNPVAALHIYSQIAQIKNNAA